MTQSGPRNTGPEARRLLKRAVASKGFERSMEAHNWLNGDSDQISNTPYASGARNGMERRAGQRSGRCHMGHDALHMTGKI